MKVISVEKISKSFKGREVLIEASATFESGTISAVVGVNGSGKSLFFRILCGFVKPETGEVYVDPQYLSKGRDYPENFGVIIDKPGFVSHLSGIANMKLLADIRKVVTIDKIYATMNDFGLNPKLKQKVRHYSLGMRQKLALVQAFMEDPRVLVLDEPFNALDSESTKMVRERLIEFRNSGGTVIFTSHNDEDVRTLADKVYELRNGKLILL